MNKRIVDTAKKQKTALLVLKKHEKIYETEAKSLLDTLGIKNIFVHYVKKPNHKYYIQQDFVKKLSLITDGTKPNLIVIYDRLRPWQYYHLMRELKEIEIWDLVHLILNIFDTHAGNVEAKLQIELLRVKHQIPFVKEYIRFSRLGEQVGFMGPGAYGYEALLKSLRRREVNIARKLKEIKDKREMQTIKRKELGLPTVSIIGYTSVGKTTLYNILTGDKKITGPHLFKTLSPKSKLINTPCGEMIVTDTIGFIRKMPPEIIDVFHSVISEIKYSDAILLLTDPTDPVEDYLEKLQVSINILRKIEALEKPIIVSLNKKDLVNEERLKSYKELTLNTMLENNVLVRDITAISALRGDGIDHLLMILCRNIDHLTIRSIYSFKG
ncbi:MAG: GTPase [Sulfolobales archaeon]